jgi:hypothetical protein
MRYLCLIYDQERDWDAMPAAESSAYLAECLAAEEAIRAAGHHVASEALHPVAAARTVRIREGRMSITDGPFAETREQLGGFYLVEARDLNEAIQIAAKIPAARYGSVEVRPVVDFTEQPQP